MAYTKERKKELVQEYSSLLQNSQAVFMLEYSKLSMKDIDAFRAKVRESGNRVNVVKNTMMNIALKERNISSEPITGTTLAGFSESDVPGLAKTFVEATKSDIFKLKGGYMDGKWVTPAEIKLLADLPPLPVLRSQLLGVLSAPATKLVRTLAEPARALAAVVKAYSDKSAPEAAVAE